MKSVSPGYFRAIGTRMIAGRDITWNDIDGRARVAIVSENFAREVWGSPVAALGQRIRESAPAGPPVWREIVGIVEDVHEDALHQAAPTMVYWPVMMENFGGAPLFVDARRSIWSSAATRRAARACWAVSEGRVGPSTRACPCSWSGR